MLVVVGHYDPDCSPTYWSSLIKVIYSFHMPLFFVLAGYLCGLFPQQLNRYGNFVSKKASRLILPLISVTAIFMLVKVVSGSLVELRHPVNLHSIYAVVMNPMESYLPSIWFMYTLFLIFLIFPLLCFMVKQNAIALCCLVLPGYFFDLPRTFCMNMVFASLPMFTFGYIAGKSKIQLDDIERSVAMLLSISGSVIYIYVCTLQNNIPTKLGLFLMSLSGSLVCIMMAVMINSFENAFMRILRMIGLYSMTIYLLHPIFISPVRIGLHSILGFDGSVFLPGAFIAIAFGVACPVFLEKKLLRKNRLAKKYILGLTPKEPMDSLSVGSKTEERYPGGILGKLDSR